MRIFSICPKKELRILVYFWWVQGREFEKVRVGCFEVEILRVAYLGLKKENKLIEWVFTPQSHSKEVVRD